MRYMTFVIGFSLLVLCSCDNPTEPLSEDTLLWSSSFEANGAPSLETWQPLDSSTAHAISFSPDVPSSAGQWSLFVPLDSMKIYSLHQNIFLSPLTPNVVYVLTYRAKCVGHGGGLAGFFVLSVDSTAHMCYNVVSNSDWTLYSDTIMPSARAIVAQVALSVRYDYSRISIDELIHPVHYDTNAVLFDDFRLVQQGK